MAHQTEIKVRGYHLDLYGHVNNARYLEFLEEGRWSAFEETVDYRKMAEKGYTFNVVNININYRRPAFLNEALVIETTLNKLGRRSGVVNQKITLKGTETVVAEADVTFVIYDLNQKRAAVLEGDLLDMLQAV